VKAVHKSQCNL